MSSFYDDASLVVIPSGYKTSKVYAEKPTDGSGDLAFTRTGDTATRVNSAGLIERVRTNLVLQSNTFSTTWANDDSTETSGQTGYDGTTNAWLLSKTAANGRIGQVLTVSGLATFSIYAKAGTDSWVRLASSDAGVNAYFNLGTGAVGSTGANTTAEITSVGNGWYRCSISGNASFTFFNIWVADADNDTSGTSGNILIQAAQVETGDIATAYIPTTTAAVSVGPVANVPRLDYLGSTCGKLLLEPQRTNLAQFSDSFNNAYWTQNATVTANSTISPSGYQDADTLTDASNSYLDVRRSFTITASTAYTFSIFVKKTTGTLTNYAGVGFSAGGGVGIGYAIFNTTTGAVNLADVAGDFALSAKSTSYGDYYRFEMTLTTGQTSLLVLIYPALSQNGTTLSSNAQGSNVFWGAQLEAGYATSYIPTLAASATRGADACSKTGISSLIGQTEGTLFVDLSEVNDLDFPEITIDNNNNTDRIVLTRSSGGNWGIFVASSAAATYAVYSTTSSTSGKFALAYSSAGYVLYRNGVQIVTGTYDLPTALSAIRFNGRSTSDFYANKKVAQALLFKTRLTNAQMQELTTL